MRSKYILVAVALVALGFGVGRLSAAVGTLDSPDVPGNTWSFTLEDIYNRLFTGAPGAQSTFTEPVAGPGTGTMHTLNDIMAQAPALDNTNGATETNVLDGRTFWGLTGGQWGTQTGTMPNNGAVTITPTTTNQAIALGYHDGWGYCEGDLDLLAANIVSGTVIFEVTGSAVVATGDAVAGDVLTGKSFSRAGQAGINGTMPDNGAMTITPTTTNQAIALGYHNGSGEVLGDTDLVSGNIKSGENIFGVDGDPMVVDTSSGDAAAGDILENKKAWVDGSEVTGNVAAGSDVNGDDGDKTFNIPDGFYSGKTATANDSDLVASNIRSGKNIFGIAGSLSASYSAGVPKTGQTTSYATGDDGDLEKGVAWPSPRFTDNSDGTVTDNLTGLIWLKDANCTDEVGGIDKNVDSGGQDPGELSWANALTWSNNLADSDCGLSDGSSAGDWRLPNILELLSLKDWEHTQPHLPVSHPFTGVQWAIYWSSTTRADGITMAWGLDLNGGYVSSHGKSLNYYHVWPVRGGQ